MVLGMIPFARELLRMGAEVVMVANSLPAINDITTPELRALLQAVSETDPVIKVRRITPWLLGNRPAACPYLGMADAVSWEVCIVCRQRGQRR